MPGRKPLMQLLVQAVNANNEAISRVPPMMSEGFVVSRSYYSTRLLCLTMFAVSVVSSCQVCNNREKCV